MNQEQRKTKERTRHKGEIPGLDPSLDSPVTEEPNYNSISTILVGFSVWLYSTESAIGLVLTLAEQGIHHTGLGSEGSFTTFPSSAVSLRFLTVSLLLAAVFSFSSLGPD